MSSSPALARIRHLLTPRYIILIVVSFAALGSIYAYWSSAYTTDGTEFESSPPRKTAPAGETVPAHRQDLHVDGQASKSAECGNYPGSDKITVIVKTGATEVLEKLPAQLVTTLKCIPDPIIVSDLEQTLGRHRVHDVLARSHLDLRQQHKDFEIYRKQYEYINSGRETDLHSLSELPIPGKDWRTEGKSAAWGLDKYKFLHMVELAWEIQPERDWYVFIEADTYLSWRNLNGFLSASDPTKPWYFGSPVRMHEHPTPLFFAYGGAGFILSGSAVRDWVVDHHGLANRWDRRIPKMWFGDFVIADALDEELKLKITDATPMMQPDEPHTVPFGDDIWCKPVVTLHHLDSRRLDQIYQMELEHNSSGLLFKDLYRSAYTKGLPFRREVWDNHADDKKYALQVVPNEVDETHGQWEPKDYLDPHRTFQACELACTRNEACFSFTFETLSNITGAEPKETTECYLSRVFRYGNARPLEHLDTKNDKFIKIWVSGWRSDRIAKWVVDHVGCP